MRPKDQKLTVMLDEDEMRMLEELSYAAGANMSQLVRAMIREKHAATPFPKKRARGT